MLGVVQHLENAIEPEFSFGSEHGNMKRLGKIRRKADDAIESLSKSF